jgi:5-methylcytosine-specific restriction enzyme B
MKTNIRDEYREWINKQTSETSNQASSYIRAIDLLSEALIKEKKIEVHSIFAIDDDRVLSDIFNLTIENQKRDDSFLFNADSPSYGRNGFYSASINKYRQFLRYLHNTESSKDITDSVNLNPIDLNQTFEENGLHFKSLLILRFTASLITKPFVILTGLSGSGKTKLAQAFVQWICKHDGGDEKGEGKKSDQYVIVPVGADWTNREPLLGYPNALNSSEYVLPDSGVLQLMLHAEKNPDLPHFLILDEMNLSHVERYFADFLSTMESNDVIPLHSVKDGLPASGIDKDYPVLSKIPSSIRFPKNLFIIGTVNIDETTHMFSPKVLDRANTIEFRISPDEMKDYLSKKSEAVNMESIKDQGASMGKAFLNLYENRAQAELDEDTKTVLNDFFRELGKTGAEFGYRTATEIRILLNQLSVIELSASQSSAQADSAPTDDPTVTTAQSQSDASRIPDEYLDIAVMQKMLPKLHGSRNKLVPVLKTLAKCCLKPDKLVDDDKRESYVDELFKKNAPNTDCKGLKDSGKVRFPMSLEKIIRMQRNAIENGFTSFAEA